MKLIIAGSRLLDVDADFIQHIINYYKLNNVTEIVSGGAIGIDRSGERFALLNKLGLKRFLPDHKLGKVAPLLRNKEMAAYGDVLLLIWDGESKGSNNMKINMSLQHKPIFEVILRREE